MTVVFMVCPRSLRTRQTLWVCTDKSSWSVCISDRNWLKHNEKCTKINLRDPRGDILHLLNPQHLQRGNSPISVGYLGSVCGLYQPWFVYLFYHIQSRFPVPFFTHFLLSFAGIGHVIDYISGKIFDPPLTEKNLIVFADLLSNFEQSFFLGNFS